MVRKLPELHLVREPAAAAASKVVHIDGIRSRPLQHAWRDLVLSLMKKPAP